MDREEENEAQKEAIQQKAEKFKMKFKLNMTRKKNDDGYSIIKEKLKNSSGRISSVRVGRPFCDITNVTLLPDKYSTQELSNQVNLTSTIDPLSKATISTSFFGVYMN